MIVVYLIIAILCLTFVQILSVKIQQSTRRSRSICAAIIGQLINDIQKNDWYSIQNGSQCNLHEQEKALLVAGLESLLED